MSEELIRQGPITQILSQEIVICPECKGSGVLKQVSKTGEVVYHRGKVVTKTCEACLGAGRMGKIMKAEYYTLPQMAEIQPKDERNFVDRMLDKILRK